MNETGQRNGSPALSGLRPEAMAGRLRLHAMADAAGCACGQLLARKTGTFAETD